MNKQESPQAQKSRSGLSRIWHAARYSLAGLKAGWHEAAFRQELILAAILLPVAYYLGQDWVERSILMIVVALVLIVELLNTAVEKAIDRIGPEWHELSKTAKDMGSAAVLIALLVCGGVWIGAIYSKFC